MITQPKRPICTKTDFPVWLPYLVFASLFVAITRADEIDTKIDEINHTLLESKIEAVEKALKSVREVAGDLVAKGDSRRDAMLARGKELENDLHNLIQQRKTKADPAELRQLTKEFEAVDGRGGWWWLANGKNEAEESTPIYRLKNKRFTHMYKDQQTKQFKEFPTYSADYDVIGVDPADENIIVVRMTYPPKKDGPGDIGLMRFNRKTGVITSDQGYYGKPKASR
jgi:hypothetical protein